LKITIARRFAATVSLSQVKPAKAMIARQFVPMALFAPVTCWPVVLKPVTQLVYFRILQPVPAVMVAVHRVVMPMPIRTAFLLAEMA
jgi:hypothetical protein